MLLHRSRRFAEQLTAVNRCVLSQSAGGNLRSHRTVLQHTHHRFFQHPANHRGLQAPAAEALHQGFFAARLHHKQHPLLGFREQEFVGRHPGFTGRHTVEIQLDAEITLGGHLRATAGQSGSAHVLGSHHITTLESLEAGLDQALLQKGIPHLHGRAVVEAVFTELGAGKAGTAHAVAAGGAAHVNHRVSHTGGTRTHDRFGLHQAQGHGIDQRVAAVAGVKGHFARNGGHTHAIAVMGDASHHALHQAGIAGLLQGPKPQRIEQGHGAGAHGEDVAQDAAHPGGCTLERLHR